MLYEWDPRKAESNEQKHGVSFLEAASVFLDPLAWTFPDPDHSRGEIRYLTLGRSNRSRLLVVGHLELEDDHLRVITARRATKREAHAYEEDSR